MIKHYELKTLKRGIVHVVQKTDVTWTLTVVHPEHDGRREAGGGAAVQD